MLVEISGHYVKNKESAQAQQNGFLATEDFFEWHKYNSDITKRMVVDEIRDEKQELIFFIKSEKGRREHFRYNKKNKELMYILTDKMGKLLEGQIFHN